MVLEKKLIQKLISSRKTLSTAESCSGGLLSSRLTDVPGSSNAFKGGVVTYCNEAKSKILKISPALIKKYGAVSPQVATRMAQNTKKLFKTDFGVGISGIAGPSGGSITKPVGLVYIAISSKKTNQCFKHLFKKTRLQVKAQSAHTAIKYLLQLLNE